VSRQEPMRKFDLQTIVLATRNSGKIGEFQVLLQEPGCRIISLDEAGVIGDVAETGNTFAENARIKALAFSQRTRFPVLADDSGLEVAALGGRPGVHSARFAGPGATDRDRNRELLRELKAAGGRRDARFFCALVLAHRGEVLLESEGECRGIITPFPRGENGFGYDPVFLLPSLGRTFAELSPAEKNLYSHRTMAVRNLVSQLKP
jgi:XTP/dITP diphosphohydrolase